MNALLAFPVYMSRPSAGVFVEHTEAMDWFVIATLCCFFFLLCCFATAAWQIWRRTVHPTPHEKFMQELANEDDEKIIQTDEESSKIRDSDREPWEKSPDWWQK
jgi:hypothetical protein